MDLELQPLKGLGRFLASAALHCNSGNDTETLGTVGGKTVERFGPLFLDDQKKETFFPLEIISVVPMLAQAARMRFLRVCLRPELHFIFFCGHFSARSVEAERPKKRLYNAGELDLFLV